MKLEEVVSGIEKNFKSWQELQRDNPDQKDLIKKYSEIISIYSNVYKTITGRIYRRSNLDG